MIVQTAAQLRVGDVFTTQADQGEVWFRVTAIETHKHLLDVLGTVVEHNPESDYAVGDSEWMDLDYDEEVIVKDEKT